MNLGIVCGSFHREEVEEMLEFAKDEAASKNWEVRMLQEEEIHGAVVLGIIERGETDHGLVMGQSVTGAVIELQIKHNKPIGLGIIGPGAKPEHIGPRLEPHARAAVGAVAAMSE